MQSVNAAREERAAVLERVGADDPEDWRDASAVPLRLVAYSFLAVFVLGVMIAARSARSHEPDSDWKQPDNQAVVLPAEDAKHCSSHLYDKGGHIYCFTAGAPRG